MAFYQDAYYPYIQQLSPEQWEFFAQDFLETFGWKTVLGPARGADEGRDLIMEYNGQRYLVSCKHLINSGKAVGTSVENNICDRLKFHNCTVFIGFYSTVPSNGLQKYLEGIVGYGSYDIFDYYRIIPSICKMQHVVLMKYFP